MTKEPGALELYCAMIEFEHARTILLRHAPAETSRAWKRLDHEERSHYRGVRAMTWKKLDQSDRDEYLATVRRVLKAMREFAGVQYIAHRT